MKIVSLQAENIKILKAVQITPDGAMICVGGRNGVGKSSVLDSILYALGGEGTIPGKPIRDGETTAKIVLNLGDLVIHRTFTEKGTKLVVKNKDGSTFSSPQSMLNQLTSALTFDPLEFVNSKPQAQLEILKKVLGIDFSEQDAEYKRLFDERTDVNRRGKDLKARVDAMRRHEDTPNEEVHISELTTKYSSALAQKTQLQDLKAKLQRFSDELEQLRSRAVIVKQEIVNTEKEIELLNTTTIEDPQELQKQISSAEEVNKRVRENKQYDNLTSTLGVMRAKSQSLTEQLNAVVEHKEKVLRETQLPIEGLGFNEAGVTLNSVSFDQCSTAEQIKISVAMGLAMNPKLKVLLIREGSLLDEDNLKLIAEMAAANEAQVWIERVSKGSECQVIIEDGMVADTSENSVA